MPYTHRITKDQQERMAILAMSPQWGARVGLAGLYTFAFFAFLGQAGAGLGIVLMLIGMFASLRDVGWHWRRDPAVWLAGAYILYLALHAIATVNEFPYTADAQWEGVRDWGRIVFFLVIAWWLRGNPNRIFTSVILALVGLFIHLLLDTDASELSTMVDGGRTGFAFSKASAAILSGACVTAMIAFTPRVLRRKGVFASRVSISVLWLVALGVLVQILLTTGYRGAWLATVVGLTVTLILTIYKGISHRQLVAVGIAFALIGFFAIQNTSIVEKRIAADRAVIMKFVEGAALEQIPAAGSAAWRLHMLHYGLKRWMERPLFGWGPGTMITRHFTPESFSSPLDQYQAEKLKEHSHLHNGFVTILAQLGLVGAVFLCLTALFVVRQLYLAGKKGLLPHDIIVAASSVLVVLFLVNLTNARFPVLDYQILASLALAIAYTTRYREPAV